MKYSVWVRWQAAACWFKVGTWSSFNWALSWIAKHDADARRLRWQRLAYQIRNVDGDIIAEC